MGLRQQRNFSMRELSEKAGVAASLISKIEAGKTSPTVTSLQKIFDALEIDFYEFFDNRAEIADPSEQVLFSKSNMVVSQDEDRKWYFAFPKHPEIKMQMTNEEYRPHTHVIEREKHNGDLAGLVIAGVLTIEVINHGRYQIKAGDAFYVKQGQLHSAMNEEDKVLKLVTAELR